MSALDSGQYGPADGASNEAALDRRGETVDLSPDDGARCFRGAGGSAHALNANLVFKWLRDPRFAPDPDASPTEGSHFPPVEVVEHAVRDDAPSSGAAVALGGTIEIDVAGGHRMRISGGYDPEALARLIRGLSG